MDTVREMVISVCALSIITGIISAAVPKGKFESQIKMLTACILLAGIFSPLVGAMQEMEFQNSAFSMSAERQQRKITEAVQQQTTALAEEELSMALKQELASMSIPCSRITVKMNTDDENSISISSVTLVSTRSEEAAEAVRKLIGEDVTIHAGKISQQN